MKIFYTLLCFLFLYKVSNSQELTHNFVDLKLPSGNLWATCNIGASSPEEYGYHFAWAETSPHPDSLYTWATYKYLKKVDKYGGAKMKKYCIQKKYGKIDNLVYLQESDDAATYNWGADWKIPTYSDFKELEDGCTWTWVTDYNQSGKSGYLGTSRYNNAYIFLPAAGSFYNGEYLFPNKNGTYWTSELHNRFSFYAFSFYFNKTFNVIDASYRFQGLSIRPVKRNK